MHPLMAVMRGKRFTTIWQWLNFWNMNIEQADMNIMVSYILDRGIYSELAGPGDAPGWKRYTSCYGCLLWCS